MSGTLASTDPRVVGGRYFSGYWAQEYTVTAIELVDGILWLTCAWHPFSESTYPRASRQWDEARVTRHCTGWDARRDVVLSAPVLAGEAGFDAQDERPFGIQGSGEAELGRLAGLEARLAGLGLDLFGGPLGSAGSTEGDR